MSSTKCALLVGQAEAGTHCTLVQGVTGHVHGQLAAFWLLDRSNITIRAELSLSSLGDWLTKVLYAIISSDLSGM